MSTPASQPPVGIDLGTTYSVVAYLDSTGRPVTVPNSSGDAITPSAVVFEDEGPVVGREAVKSSVLEPSRFADCFKRDMGRKLFRRALGQLEVPPEVLSAFILEKLKQDAQHRLGPIERVVVTVPAFFDESRRKATQEAGRLAGLEVLDIINEPTAAAIAFGHYRSLGAASAAPADESHGERILVYDLGGGTFDVTVLEIKGRNFRTLATDGDVQLGGKDFDERLVDHLARQFVDAHGIDPRSDPHDAAQLWLDAQEAKHALSERAKTIVVCVHAGIRMRLEVTRSQFEELSRDLLERTETTTQLVLRQANIGWEGIDRVLLVGGSSRIPMVAEMLRRASGKEPDRTQSPDEAVAHGAALYAGMLMAADGSPQAARFTLVNVNSHSLGVVGIDPQTRQKVNAIVIPKNTPLPCRAVRRFKTAHDNQPNVKVSVVEGESQRPDYCIALGQCVIRNLPAGLPQGSTIEVEYQYSANGRISVLARVPAVRQSASVEIQPDVARDLGDLNSWRRKLCPRAEITPTPAEAAANARPIPVPTGRAATVKRLDDLYVQVGTAALPGALPEELHKSRLATQAAAAEAREAQSACQRAEEARQ
ncbi:MAG TPA: Hsp70 family protein, partial [Pirellulales bacterium]|nr:Hsp70 family protein [Pirellulales bacterium]